MDNINQKKISIIMNCYNGQEFLREAIDSIIKQTYKNWELIFFNNCSKDNSVQIVQDYNNENIKIFNSNEHLILSEARNLAIEKATGDFIAFLDADDVWLEDKIEKQINALSNQSNQVIYTNLWIKDKKLKIFSKKNLPEGKIFYDILTNYPIFLSTVMFDSKIFHTKKYKFNRYEIIQDFDLFFRLSKDFNFSVIQEPLVIYRSHENMASKKKFELHIKEWEEWINKYNNKIEPNYLYKIKNNTNYNKCKIYLQNNNLKLFFSNLKLISNYFLILKLIIKFFIQKIKIK